MAMRPDIDYFRLYKAIFSKCGHGDKVFVSFCNNILNFSIAQIHSRLKHRISHGNTFSKKLESITMDDPL